MRLSSLRPLHSVVRLLSSVLLLALPALALAQGQLTPPDGAVGPRGPVPTMKTLTQVEPRTLIRAGAHGVELAQNGGFILTASGSYYLDANLSVSSGNAITISASAVTLDLNGFLIISFAGDDVVRGAGIVIGSDVSNVTIRNGHIRGTATLIDGTFTAGGFDYGIHASATASNTLVEDISASGITQSVISLTNASVASRCTASVCGISGISARIVRDCVAEQCLFIGITATTAENCVAQGTLAGMAVDNAANCRGESTGSFYGIAAAESVVNCIGRCDSGRGITAKTALNSRGVSRTAEGLSALIATGCIGESTSGTGLRADSAQNCRGHSTEGTGLEVAENADNCDGSTSTGSYGLQASMATNCSGYTTSGDIALNVAGTANSCRGHNEKAGGTAIKAAIAVACTSAGGAIHAGSRYNMP